MGYLCLEDKAEKRQGNTEAVVAAIDTIRKSGRSLFKLAVMSGKANVVDYVYREIICNYFQDQSKVIMNIRMGQFTGAVGTWQVETDRNR